MEIHGNLVDIHKEEIFSAAITVEGGRIVKIARDGHRKKEFIMPGFIDSHIHIESSMLPPSEFARLALRHGTVATVSDPHEIANVLGMEGIEYMLDDSRKVPFKFYFGAPSCVPATQFESSGATLGAEEVRALLSLPDIYYLSEVMNYPGVIARDPELMAKIAAAKEANKPIDGHAPGLHGSDLEAYFQAGITTDHECFQLTEAREKHSLGMKILVREGSAARNFEVLYPMIQEDPETTMLCSDDLHPNQLILGHINLLVRRALQKGIPLFDVLKCACRNPVLHYNLDVGLLREGDPADFIIVEDLESLRVKETYIDGLPVFRNGEILFPRSPAQIVNKFGATQKTPRDFEMKATEGTETLVIRALDGELITEKESALPTIFGGKAISDPKRDLLKIAVVNRYVDAPVAVGFISGFGLREGALASSVAHDSHNVVAVGTSDEALAAAVNLVIEAKGGLATDKQVLPLPIAGLMSPLPGEEVARRYSDLEELAHRLGSALKDPFMTLSFMALLVIPKLKMSDLGLFDGESFNLLESPRRQD
ncbi:MAG: Adenine deaminase [Chlamydiae bacterium]|nr:Adenine deaminase [Chlamydiota bacterium]